MKLSLYTQICTLMESRVCARACEEHGHAGGRGGVQVKSSGRFGSVLFMTRCADPNKWRNLLFLPQNCWLSRNTNWRMFSVTSLDLVLLRPNLELFKAEPNPQQLEPDQNQVGQLSPKCPDFQSSLPQCACAQTQICWLTLQTQVLVTHDVAVLDFN